jgi:8-oxo-dGTP diphosphatase
VFGYYPGMRRDQRGGARFLLVRHALAVSKQKWSDADEARPLNREGLRQSRGLVRTLRDFGVSRLLSSPAVRCQMTLTPASQELFVPIAFRDALAVGAPVTDLLSLLDSESVENAALCTHGETFAALSRAWAVTWTGASAAPDLTDTAKGGSWIIRNYGSASASAEYLGVPATEPVSLHLAT